MTLDESPLFWSCLACHAVKLDFMPDILSWTSKGNLLAAEWKGARGDCATGSGTPCIQVSV